MATPIPLKDLPQLSPNELQQVLLERDESVERALKILELKGEIDNLKAEFAAYRAAAEENLAKVINEKDIKIEEAIAAKDAALAMLNTIRSTIGAAIETPEMIALKKAEALAAKQKADEESARLQALIDSMNVAP